MNNNTELDIIAAIISRISKDAYNELLRRLSAGEDAKKILTDIANKLVNDYQLQLAAAGMAFMHSDFDTLQTDQVICPHCGYEYSDSLDMDDGAHDCPECGKKFQLTRQETTTYSTWKKEEK
ncbi:rubrerythrin all-iron(iI) form [Caudoviricetes sp.]|nr:rubrerythrin all-iron(iI) form [Caudoviricetes sp.]